MKLHKQNLFVFALSVLLCINFIIPVRAGEVFDSLDTYIIYHRTGINGITSPEKFFTPRLTTDPSEVTYYISTKSAFSAYAEYARDAFDHWNSSTYDINMTETTSYASSVIDVKGFDPDSLDPADFDSLSDYNDMYYCLGYTNAYYGDGAYSGTNYLCDDFTDLSQDYWLAEIYINYDSIPASSLNTNEHKVTHTFSHEIGHALGLGHNQSSNTNLMYSGYSSNISMYATQNEQYQIRLLYSYR